MPKLQITDTFLNRLILEVAPLVATFTGWDLGLTSLRVRSLPRRRGYEEVVVARLHGLGIADWQAYMPAFLERLIEYTVEQNTLAAYMSETGEILVIRQNVDDSNLDGLKLVLAHELVHRGQHRAYPHLFDQVDGLLRRAFEQVRSGATDFQYLQEIMGEAQPVMSLIESHASYVQGYLKQTVYPGARIESHFNLATLLMRVVGAPKVAQYTESLPQVAAAMDSGDIESLYQEFNRDIQDRQDK